jgi:DNA-binding SARP family transcriptional activator
MAPSCEVRLLGGFSVTVDDRPVSVDSWRSRRAADLVKLLAMQSNRHLHREQVMEALWPDLSPEAAAANLRKAVHYARRAMGTEDAIAFGSGMLELWPHGTLNVDLDRFVREADEALSSKSRDACALAVRSYPGELLPADRYEAWAEDARARAQARCVALLKGAEEWDRVLAMDPTDEEAHRALMQLHLDAGNRREAIRQFERLRHALREHIGVGPDPLTVGLYEKVLDLEGPQPPTPSERAAALLANALVVWSRRDLAEAERLAREARAVALSAELSHEVGEASTLLALISYARGTWHDLFREQFADAVRRDSELEMAVLDAHLCFQEFYLYGPEGHAEAAGFARELLRTATRAKSAAGEALATLLLGEFELLSGEINAAAATLEQAVGHAQRAACPSACSIALERLAETEVGRGNKKHARSLLERARPLAQSSDISSHLVVRVLGVQVCAADRMLNALKVVRDAERLLADAPRICEPCSMNFRVEAARVLARSGDISRARTHIAEADRITSLWQGGPWKAAVWEARAELRLAEGENSQARALFLEAAEGFAQVRRPIDEARCREAALAVLAV